LLENSSDRPLATVVAYILSRNSQNSRVATGSKSMCPGNQNNIMSFLFTPRFGSYHGIALSPMRHWDGWSYESLLVLAMTQEVGSDRAYLFYCSLTRGPKGSLVNFTKGDVPTGVKLNYLGKTGSLLHIAFQDCQELRISRPSVIEIDLHSRSTRDMYLNYCSPFVMASLMRRRISPLPSPFLSDFRS